MKKIGLGTYVMVIVAAVAIVLSVSLWYATPWRTWRAPKAPIKKAKIQPPAGQQVPVPAQPAK